ncbi:MAG: S-adenosyl-L-homocysteine hydrolase [Pseudomonadota bacterium]
MLKAAVLSITASVIATTSFAAEDPVCMQSAELEASLVDWYNETLVSMETPDTFVWASGVGGTWTLVEYIETADGEVACVIATGTDWQPNMGDDMLLALAEN